MRVPFPHIFKRYDIRGIAGEELTPPLVQGLGRAVGTYLRRHGKTGAVVGRDGRLTGREYLELFIQGMLTTGVDVIDLGVCPTPLMYFAIHHFGAGGGVAVTASHNPPQYNGFKVCCGSDSIYDDEILSLRALVEAEDFEVGVGRLRKASIIPAT